MKYKNLLPVLTILTVFIVSCGVEPQETITVVASATDGVVPSEISSTPLPNTAEAGEVHLVGDSYQVQSTYEVRANNCDGQSKNTNVGRSLSQERTTSFQVSVELGGLVKGSPIPAVLEAQLEAKIQAQLDRTYGVVSQQDISIEIETQPGTAYDHTITWNETKVKGIIDVIFPDGTGQVEFEKIIKIELFDRTSTAVVCDGIPPTIIAPQETLISTPTNEQPTQIPKTPDGTILSIGEWWYKDGKGIIVDEIKFPGSDSVQIDLRITNFTSNVISFEYPEENFSLTDNLDQRQVASTVNCNALPTITLEPGKTKKCSIFIYGVAFANMSVNELIFKIDAVSTFQNARWKIPINH